MAAHCTATTDTKCLPCRANHYTALWNYLPRCLYCNNICTRNQEVEIQCSATNNRVCRCKQGYYMKDDFCISHSQCGPGHGVQTKGLCPSFTGTSKQDTVCEKCADGFFSRSTSALDVCVKHQECADGQLPLFTGSVYHDALCGSCEDLASDSETLRKFLSAYFEEPRRHNGKMKRFVATFVRESRRKSGLTFFQKKVGPLERIKAWLANAPAEQLRLVPQMLRNSTLTSLADKIDRRLHDIMNQSPNCSLISP
ncbi:Tumor necrosis factor receptor superfamily member 11B [Oryzias melastigma]|uniref:Tumor necrosis factor receptor superfamily member 11B n=1 Tax=Oryzias melastigma TaxID=30732 RepID=A0A834C9E2_ORYME|nr:Tumor necrosis factor receptor superfamily member 11B [Oryzias melastigma]